MYRCSAAFGLLVVAGPELLAADNVRVLGSCVEVRAAAAPLADVLRELSEETGFRLVVDGAPPRRPVDLDLSCRPVRDVVIALLEGSDVNYALRFDATGSGIETLMLIGSPSGSSKRESTSAPAVEPPVSEPVDAPEPLPPALPLSAPPEEQPTVSFPPGFVFSPAQVQQAPPGASPAPQTSVPTPSTAGPDPGADSTPTSLPPGFNYAPPAPHEGPPPGTPEEAMPRDASRERLLRKERGQQRPKDPK